MIRGLCPDRGGKGRGRTKALRLLDIAGGLFNDDTVDKNLFTKFYVKFSNDLLLGSFSA